MQYLCTREWVSVQHCTALWIFLRNWEKLEYIVMPKQEVSSTPRLEPRWTVLSLSWLPWVVSCNFSINRQWVCYKLQLATLQLQIFFVSDHCFAYFGCWQLVSANLIWTWEHVKRNATDQLSALCCLLWNVDQQYVSFCSFCPFTPCCMDEAVWSLCWFWTKNIWYQRMWGPARCLPS